MLFPVTNMLSFSRTVRGGPRATCEPVGAVCCPIDVRRGSFSSVWRFPQFKPMARLPVKWVICVSGPRFLTALSPAGCANADVSSRARPALRAAAGRKRALLPRNGAGEVPLVVSVINGFTGQVRRAIGPLADQGRTRGWGPDDRQPVRRRLDEPHRSASGNTDVAIGNPVTPGGCTVDRPGSRREEDSEFAKDCSGPGQSQVRLYAAIARHTVLVMAAAAICAVTAALLRRRTDTQAPPRSSRTSPRPPSSG